MRCETHGLILGPDGSCIRCRNSQAPKEQAWKGWALLGGGIFTVLLVMVGVKVVLAFSEARERGDRVQASEESFGSPSTSRPSAHGSSAGRTLAPGETPTIETELTNVEVVVYTTSWCGACKAARKWLAANNVPHTELDIEKDDDARRQMKKISRGNSIPTFDIEGNVQVGFNPQWVQSTRRKVAAAHLSR